ncbi:MAG: N-acetylmuramoyl-L-alanine amidase [Nitrosomonas sp.]|nr:N-acetylmuramoyl-L-alanine amidase [Nitrosomonas sp.]
MNQLSVRSLTFFSFLIITFFLLLASYKTAVADTQITAARYWADKEYTRVAMEVSKPVKYKISTLDAPKRIVMDIEDVALSGALNDLSGKLKSQDPLVKALKIGRSAPQTTRLVIELKADAVPRAFVLAPDKQYGHRLVLDIHASQSAGKAQETENYDPLMALLRKETRPAAMYSPRPVAQKPNSNLVMTAINRSPGSKQNFVVAIDAGHGGKDPGAVGPRGTMEKDITLSVAKKLKARIDKEPGMRAVLIRDGDYFISLAGRRIKARQANADLFISVHADAAPRREAHGASVYALSEHGATSTTASWLAKKENEVDLLGGVKLDDKDRYLKQTLIDLSLNATIDDSIRLGSHVLNEIGSINHLHKRNVEQAGFAVLKSPDIPSILIETAFISNHSEEAKLNSEIYQNKLVDAISSGLKRYHGGKSWQTRVDVADTR